MTRDTIYDAIVVGLGPGGSSAARALAEKGLRVLGLDRARFPRHKPCGGCLSLKIGRVLDADQLRPLVERDIHGATLCFRGGGSVHARSARPVAHMVTRLRFDAHLVAKAREAGAEIREGEAFKGLVQERGAVTVTTERGRYRGRVVVGADGVNSAVSRAVGLSHRGWKAVLIEAEVSVDDRALGGLGDEVIMEFGTVPFGYGWIFPKADHLSIGVGGMVGRIGSLNEHYRDFLSRHRILGGIKGETRHGYTLPVYSERRPLVRGNVLLVGDAAGLVDPFIGEGIYYAIRSGRIAADAIETALDGGGGDLSPYDRAVDREMGREFRASHRLARLVYTFPDAFTQLASDAPNVLEGYFDVLRGERSHTGFLGEMGKKVLADLLTYTSLLRTRPADATRAYNRAAPHYDAYNRLWRSVCAGVWEELDAQVTSLLPPDAAVLDAGGGTGAATALLLSKDRVGRADLVDLSPGMLRVAAENLRDPRVRLVRGDMARLPYPDRTFDLVVSTWAIETTPDPKKAVAELVRVIKDDGAVIYTFCSLPEGGLGRVGAHLVEAAMGRRFAFRFLPRRERPYHSCSRSRLVTFLGGLMTLVVLRKCCTVSDEAAPCTLPASWEASLAERAAPALEH